MSDIWLEDDVERVAVIGMAGRFPGARNIHQFWQNLRDGVESITVFSDEELISTGIHPQSLKSPSYIKARGHLDDTELFDASFFGFTPREAELMDPQLRLFLEHSWEAIEDAGYAVGHYDGVIGIYGGMSVSDYLLHNLLPNSDVVESAGALQLRIFNDKDFLTTLVAYKLDLKGPSVNVQTACSTSLVAINLACQSLLNFQCDMVLAGGVSITVPEKAGYWSREGVYSPDGHCRAFDAKARGTVNGSGVGIVVLKRLTDALKDGDSIYAVIKGSAINNDGSLKVGYTSPSVEGQAEVITLAQALAGVDPETVTYIEAHGTGTPMGDSIEIAALTQAFRATSEKKNFCAVGSVKTNVGHSDAAAGVTSFIKTVLALNQRMLPPSLNFDQPNLEIDFADTPFYVNSRLTEWRSNGAPRRAGVSSFSVGGINSHVVVEEAPPPKESGPSRPWQLILFSAKTETAVWDSIDRLVIHLKENTQLKIADVAYTLQIGRKSFERRRAVVCRDLDDLAGVLEARNPKRILASTREASEHTVAFMFPGLGNHYVDMGWDLYQGEPTFRLEFDHCCELLRPHLGVDLRDIIYPDWRQRLNETPNSAAVEPNGKSGLDLREMLRGGKEDEANRRLNQAIFTQPALFVIEYALARLWMAWGIAPKAMIGYSIGEYVAACLAGVLSLDDALMLVAKRAQLIHSLPEGGMLAIPLSAQDVRPLLTPKLSIAAINGPSVSVVSGEVDEINALERKLAQMGLAIRRLQTTHAFHSPMMRPIVSSLTSLVGTIKLNPPQIPVISNVTGSWLTAGQATDPHYWGGHLCQPVLFGEGIQKLWNEPNRALLEVGPGQALCAWALQHPAAEKAEGQVVLPSLRHSYDQQHDMKFLLTTLGKMWLTGVTVDWARFYAQEQRRRIHLPTYPFERQRYWIEQQKRTGDVSAQPTQVVLKKRENLADWFYLPLWKQSQQVVPVATEHSVNQARWHLIFIDDCGVGSRLAEQLTHAGQNVVTVRAGERFERLDEQTFVIDPRRSADYDALLADLRMSHIVPQAISHLWSVTVEGGMENEIVESDRIQDLGFFSLLFLAQALGNRNVVHPLFIMVVSNGVHTVNGHEKTRPAKATLLGPCLVIPQEYSNIECRSIDITLPTRGTWQEEMLISQLINELTTNESDRLIAYRGERRWVQTFEPVHLNGNPGQRALLREKGVYLITGGMGGIGLTLAENLARAVRAKLVLTGRAFFPERDEWQVWMATDQGGDDIKQKIQRVKALEDLGAEALVLSADVTSREDMERVIAAAHARFGKICGVIHAAGAPPGGIIQVKSAAAANDVLAPKVKGTLILDDLLKDEDLDFLALCSSLNSFIGVFGLADHCAANAFLDAFAEFKYSRRKTLTLSVNWDAWQEVGQAANASLAARLKTILQDTRSDKAGRLLDRCLVSEPNRTIYATQLSAAKNWFLDEHRLMGNAVLPGTVYLEMVRVAFAGHASGKAIVIQKVFFVTPLVVKDGETKEVRIIITKSVEGFEFQIVSESASNTVRGSEQHTHVIGKLTYSDSGPSPKSSLLASALERISPEEIGVFNSDRMKPEGHTSSTHTAELLGATAPNMKEEVMRLGPRWRRLLKEVGFVGDEGIASLELPEEFSDDLKDFDLHPALLDVATGFVQLKDGGGHLPLAYGSVKINGPLTRKIFSYVKCKQDNGRQGEVIACDINIMDQEGNELLEIKDYILRRVKAAGDIEARVDNYTNQASANAPSLTQTEIGDQPPEKESVKLHNLQDGILPSEGAAAFDYILRSGMKIPRIVVSPRPLEMIIRQGRTLTGARILESVNELHAHRKKHPRPNLHVPYIMARNEIEKEITETWQEVLGVSEVGIHDNFFDLGGDSLLATLLIGRLSEAFNIDISLRLLFSSPTIAELAVSIVQERAARIGAEPAAALLGKIKNLSGDEVREMLKAERLSRDVKRHNN
jgi:acyl transferase domain-containing protein/acyl carrier protein